MTKNEDAVFMRVAEARIAQDPLNYYLMVRAYNSVHYWVNLASASYLLQNQAKLSRSASKFVTGLFLSFKAIILCFAIYGFYAAFKIKFISPIPSKYNELAGYFVLLGVVFVLMRTFLFAFYVNAVEFRYVTPAWPFVIFAAVFGMISIINQKRFFSST